MTYEDQQALQGFFVLFVLLGIYWLRNTPLGFLWKLTRIFLLVLLVTLGINYAKKSIKEWWNK